MPTVREENKAAHSNGSGLWARAMRRWRWLWIGTEPPETNLVFAPADLKPSNEADGTKNETLNFTNLLPFKLIAWLGASAGGLTLLLVVIGFLALSAHDAMLGIPRSIQNNPEYVAVGGLFFGRSIMFLVANIFFAKSWIAPLIVSIGALVLFKILPRRSRGRSVLIILFGIALLVGEFYALARLTWPLQISDLLLQPSVEANNPAKQVVDALVVNDLAWLRVEYGFLVLLVVTLATAFILMERASRSGFWQVVRVPALILLVICVFLLPRAYGVLTISNAYPTVVLESSSPTSSSAANETRLLLRENDKVFVLYDPTSQSIVTVKRDSIAQHKVYAPQHVFTASVGKK